MANPQNDNPLLEMPFGTQVMNHWKKHRRRAMKALGEDAQAAMVAAAEMAEQVFNQVRERTGDAEMANELVMTECVLLPDLDPDPSPMTDDPWTIE